MILQCKSDAMSEKGIDAQQARFLINLKDEHLLLLASRADEITREINGTDVDACLNYLGFKNEEIGSRYGYDNV